MGNKMSLHVPHAQQVEELGIERVSISSIVRAGKRSIGTNIVPDTPIEEWSQISCLEDIAEPTVALKMKILREMLMARADHLYRNDLAIATIFGDCDELPDDARLQNLFDDINACVSRNLDWDTTWDTLFPEDNEDDAWRLKRDWSFSEVYETLFENGEDVRLTWAALKRLALNKRKKMKLQEREKTVEVQKVAEETANVQKGTRSSKRKRGEDSDEDTEMPLEKRSKIVALKLPKGNDGKGSKYPRIPQ